MDTSWSAHVEAHLRVVRESLDGLAAPAASASGLIVGALAAGRQLIAFGNGGSAAQASHLAGELVGRFRRERRPLPALALAADAGVVTCIGNDFGYDALFERQVEAFARPGDVVIGFTTSGRSENVLRGLARARASGAATVALTGAAGLARDVADLVLAVPSDRTAHVQEVHQLLLHAWCAAVDEALG